MNAHELIAKIMHNSATTKNDRESNILSRVANRLAHQGCLFEPELTREEISVIQRFM
jgi:hypothetical protein